MAIKHRQPRLSIVLSSSSTTPSPEKPSLKRCSLPGPRPKSTRNPPAARQSNQDDQVLVDQLKTEGPRQIQQLKKHLILLDSFNVLIHLSQQTILAFNPNSSSSTDDDPTKNSSDLQQVQDLERSKLTHRRQELEDSFYHLILFRFELWLGRIADHLPKSLFQFDNHHQSDLVNLKNREDDYEIELTLDYLPPLDVLFVWYCYCFNSRNYYEDSLRLYPVLKHLRFPLDLAASEYDCSCACTNYEKLKSKTKVENPAEAEALLKAIKTISSTDESLGNIDTNHVQEALKNPSLLSSLLIPKNFNTKAGANSKNLWVTLTNTNFNIIDFINQPSYRTFICPLCSDTIESPFYVRDLSTKLVQVIDWCWPNSSDPKTASQVEEKLEQGEVQQETPIDKNFKATHKNHARLKCQNCRWSGSKQDLSLFKFATELKFCLSNLSYTNHHTNISDSTPIDCLAGTLTTSETLNDGKNAAFFNKLLLQDQNDAIFKHFNERNPSDINIDCLNYLKKVQHSIKFTILNNNSIPFTQRNKIERSFNNLLKSYCVPEPFSVDLIRSMKIQSHFVKRMVKFGWTEISSQQKKPATVPQEEIDYRFQSCISRYKAFSNLVSTTQPHLILIPTSDIDLAWKTDRLRGVRYTESMMRNNKIMIDHPDEFDFDKSKFFDQFRLTSALWIHRYQIEYSRYPAPFVRCDRRQNWLKKALAHIEPLPESNSRVESPNKVYSAQEKNDSQTKSTESSIRKTSTTEEIHPKLDSHEAAPKPRSRMVSTGVIELRIQNEWNPKTSMTKPVQTRSELEASTGIKSPDEPLVEPITTPEIQLLEHKAAQISVASYFENIYTADDSVVKSGSVSLQVTPLKQSEQKTRPRVEKKEEKLQPQKGKQVAEDAVGNGSSSVDTLYSPSSCSPSTPAIENEIGSSSHSEAAKPDAGVIYEAKRISIKFSEDAKNPNRLISKVYSVIEPFSWKKNAFVPKPLPQTDISPIRISRLDPSITRHHQTGKYSVKQPLRQANIKNQPHVDANSSSGSSAQKSDKHPHWLKGIRDPAGYDASNHEIKQPTQAPAKSSTTHSLHPKDNRLNHKDEPNSQKMTSTQNQTLDTDKKKTQDTQPIFNNKTTENRQKSKTSNSHVPSLLSPPLDRKNMDLTPTTSTLTTVPKIVDPLADYLDSSSPKNSFFEIPIGKIAFVEDGNKLRCL